MQGDRPRVKANVRYHDFNGELLVFSKAKDAFFHLNQTASLIFYFCDGEHTPRDILGELKKIYKQTKPSTLEQDIQNVLHLFKKQGIIG